MAQAFKKKQQSEAAREALKPINAGRLYNLIDHDNLTIILRRRQSYDRLTTDV